MAEENKLTAYQLEEAIRICKGAYSYRLFLSGFEERLIVDTAMRYAQYGKEIRLSYKQLKTLKEIEQKLYL